MEKTKVQMEPGVHYRGTAWINEYGEIHFCPEQKGSRPSNMCIVHQEGCTTIYESRRYIRVQVQIPKQAQIFQTILNKFGEASTIVARYFNAHK